MLSATGEENSGVEPRRAAARVVRNGPPVSRRRSFDADPAAIGAARHFVRRLLDGDERAGDAALIVSELATNALCHARSPFYVTVTLGKRLRIEVRDRSALPPVPRVPAPDAVDARGLQIVAALACAWGTRPDPEGGKVVWAELEAR